MDSRPDDETLARPASLGNAATAIFALLGLIDVALTAVGPVPPADGHSAAAREACATAGPPPGEATP
jgi:hypothetical protein